MSEVGGKPDVEQRRELDVSLPVEREEKRVQLSKRESACIISRNTPENIVS